MSIKPQISVVLPVHRVSKFLGGAVNSILNQSFKNFEFIIIDDSDSKEIEYYFRKFNDSRLRFFKNDFSGLANAYNCGIKNSNSDLLAFMDYDDLSHPKRFELQIDYLNNHPRIGILGTNYNVIDESGKLLSLVKHPKSSDEIKRFMFHHCGIMNPTSIVRKSVFLQNGYFNQKFYPAQDYEFYLRILDHVEFANLQLTLHSWRSHGNSTSVSNFKLQLDMSYKILKSKIENELEKGNISKSIAYFKISKAAYYYSSIIKSMKYNFLSLLRGNFRIDNILALMKALFLFIPIKYYRDHMIKKSFGINYSSKF